MTFDTDLGEVALVPGTGGVFQVRVNGEMVWDRRVRGRFPVKILGSGSGMTPLSCQLSWNRTDPMISGLASIYIGSVAGQLIQCIPEKRQLQLG